MVNHPPATQAMWQTWLNPWVREIPWRRAWQPTPALLPGNGVDRGAWWATALALSSHTLGGRAQVSRSPKLTQNRRSHKRNCRWFLQESKNQNPSLDPHSIRPTNQAAPGHQPPKAATPSQGRRNPQVIRAGEGVGRWAGGAVTLTKPPRHRNEDLMHLQ